MCNFWVMIIKNFMKTCSSRRNFKIFTDFHIFSRKSGSRLLTIFFGLGVARKISRLHIPGFYPRILGILAGQVFIYCLSEKYMFTVLNKMQTKNGKESLLLFLLKEFIQSFCCIYILRAFYSANSISHPCAFQR